MKFRVSTVVFTLACLCALVIAGCQKRTVIKPDESAQQQQQQGQQQKDQEKVTEKKLDGKVESVDVTDKGSQYTESKESLFSDILFDYDQYEVKDTYKQLGQSIADWMTKNSTARLSIEGHCDERGTNEYNLALGDRRAKAVKDYLVSFGVASGRIDIISFGEEKSVCKEQTEECWAKNRRAHFTVLKKAGK